MGWEDSHAAEAWTRNAATRAGALAAATDLMFELARLPIGGAVLDVGTGTGDTALIAAALVGDIGRVDAVDSSPAMVEAARRATEHLSHVEVTLADAQDLPFDGPFDAAIARNALMLVDDPPAAFRELHRVLAPGHRVALTVWSSLTRNPRLELPVRALEALGVRPPPGASLMRVFGLGDPDRLRRVLVEAGFEAVEVHRVPAATTYADPAEFRAELRRHPGALELLDRLSEQQRERAFAWMDAEAGEATVVEGEQLVAAGTRPQAAR